MTIRLHDTLTGEGRPLEPLEPGLVRIYSCGPTVYGPTHTSAVSSSQTSWSATCVDVVSGSGGS